MEPAMNLIRFLILALLFSFPASGKGRGGKVRVDGHYKKNGTYVAPHYRTTPNGTKNDNWSTIGNVNPYTGDAGTKNPDEGTVYLYPALVEEPSSSAPNSPDASRRVNTYVAPSTSSSSYISPVFVQSSHPIPAPVYSQSRYTNQANVVEPVTMTKNAFFSRYSEGKSQLTLSLKNAETGSRSEDVITGDSVWWDIAGIRIDRVEMVLFYSEQKFESNLLGFVGESSVKSGGFRVSYLPLKEDFGPIRLQGGIGIGAGLSYLHTEESLLSWNYAEVNGPMLNAGANVDILFFKLIGASVHWNGMYAETDQYENSSKTFAEDSNSAVADKSPKITQGSLTYGLLLNIEF